MDGPSPPWGVQKATEDGPGTARLRDNLVGDPRAGWGFETHILMLLFGVGSWTSSAASKPQRLGSSQPRTEQRGAFIRPRTFRSPGVKITRRYLLGNHHFAIVAGQVPFLECSSEAVSKRSYLPVCREYRKRPPLFPAGGKRLDDSSRSFGRRSSISVTGPDIKGCILLTIVLSDSEGKCIWPWQSVVGVCWQYIPREHRSIFTPS